MSEPPAKKLKQQTLLSSFRRQQSLMSSSGERSSSPTRLQMRQKMADAAELRRLQAGSGSPVSEESCGTEDSNKTPALDESQSLFSDGSQEATLSYSMAESLAGEAECSSFGCSADDLLRFPDCAPPLGVLTATPHHAVLFNFNDVVDKAFKDCPPRPYPSTRHDRWDAHHVRMPCSDENVYPGKGPDGKKTLLLRWKLVEHALGGSLRNSSDVEKAILSYNSRYVDRWNFVSLHQFLGLSQCGSSAAADHAERGLFMSRTIPNIAKLALRLPQLVTRALPLLRRGGNRAVSLSQEQVACLLANAFFCTFPRRNAQQRQSEYSSFPTINFSSIFSGERRGSLNPARAAKLRCLLHYFQRVTTNMPTGTVTYERCCVSDLPRWDKCQQVLSDLCVCAKGTIEDDGEHFLQVDFANKFLGGGVLSYGCVQEEIRFLLCPELLLTRLFVEELGDNECVVVTGAERFSSYTGYADSFCWSGNYNDTTKRDAWKRRHVSVVAIDALVFRSHHVQFRPPVLRRELSKAYCGFRYSTLSQTQQSAVATGNWGCGAFGGDAHLKALLQLMAAAVANRQMLYFTFGNTQLARDLADIHSLLREHKATVADIWKFVCDYYSHLEAAGKTKQTSGVGLHVFIRKRLKAYSEETDSNPSPSTADSVDSPPSVEISHSVSSGSPDVATAGMATSPGIVLSPNSDDITLSPSDDDIVAPSPTACIPVSGEVNQLIGIDEVKPAASDTAVNVAENGASFLADAARQKDARDFVETV